MVRRPDGQGPTQAVSRSLPIAIPEELRGQGVLYRLPRHPRAASGLALLLRAPPPLRVGGCSAHPFGHGASHAWRNGVYALGDVRALCAHGACLQSPEALPRLRGAPELPVGYTDRAGRLMADVQYTVERLDTAVRSLEELATRDHLTGAYNRRAAEERLAEDLKRAERGGGTLSLALFDLDHLKAINDEHGHRAGDACVVRFAEVLNRNMRAGDWVARWGGDEFVVGMWNTQEEGQPTERVLERLAEDLRPNPVVLPGGEEAHLTFSGGACQWKPGYDVRGLVSRADEALYRAKAEGGDAVVHLD